MPKVQVLTKFNVVKLRSSI